MQPDLIDTVAALDLRLTPGRLAGARIGLVPTMGALHDGHASLIARAREECECVVVSIFVNPLQFDRPDDFERYPRTLETDIERCAGLGVDVVFAPSTAEMYPVPPACSIDVGKLVDHLCGQFRPGHFRGVATVVMKLFQIVRPDVAYFGEKDAQQLAIVRRIVADFSVPMTIVGMPTVREPDGLALSSRNRRLNPAERRVAPALYRALQAARSQIDAGETDSERVKQHAVAEIPHSQTLEYLEIVDPDEMQPVGRITGPVLAAGALWVGDTRLIDNVRCEPPAER